MLFVYPLIILCFNFISIHCDVSNESLERHSRRDSVSRGIIYTLATEPPDIGSTGTFLSEIPIPITNNSDIKRNVTIVRKQKRRKLSENLNIPVEIVTEKNTKIEENIKPSEIFHAKINFNLHAGGKYVPRIYKQNKSEPVLENNVLKVISKSLADNVANLSTTERNNVGEQYVVRINKANKSEEVLENNALKVEAKIVAENVVKENTTERNNVDIKYVVAANKDNKSEEVLENNAVKAENVVKENTTERSNARRQYASRTNKVNKSEAVLENNVVKTTTTTTKATTVVENVLKESTTERSNVSRSGPRTFPKRPPEFNPVFKKRRERDPVVRILSEKNFVYGHNGNFHYSYEGGDGTKVYGKGNLISHNERKAGEAVVGGYSYKDEEGNDYSLSYTADQNGYRPVGAHLPTPPPIPPEIARALKYLATKSTPEPVTDEYQYYY